MGNIGKPKHSVGEYVQVKQPARNDSFAEWAGSINAAYWSEESDCWLYRVAKNHNWGGAEVKEEEIIVNLSRMKEAKIPKTKKYTPWDMQASKFLVACIERNKLSEGGKERSEAEMEQWANEFRMMREVDNLPEDEIKRVLLWSQQDTFWRKNILSPSKLRKQFTRLQTQSVVEQSERSLI